MTRAVVAAKAGTTVVEVDVDVEVDGAVDGVVEVEIEVELDVGGSGAAERTAGESPQAADTSARTAAAAHALRRPGTTS